MNKLFEVNISHRKSLGKYKKLAQKHLQHWTPKLEYMPSTQQFLTKGKGLDSKIRISNGTMDFPALGIVTDFKSLYTPV